MRQIDAARTIMESFDNAGGMTVGYEGTYTLTAEQMTVIAGALYLAECDLHDINGHKG